MGKKAYKKYKHKSRFIGLGDRLTDEVISDALGSLVHTRFGTDARISSVTTTHLAKCVFTCELTMTGSTLSAPTTWTVVAKTFPDRERLEKAYSLLEAFWQNQFSRADANDGIFVPEPYAVHLPSNFMFMERIPGISLRKLIKKDPGPAREGMRLFARALAKMQQCNVPVNGKITLAEEYQRREKQYRDLKEAYPHFRHVIDHIIRESIRREQAADNPPMLVHGDYNLGQLHVSGSQCWLLDFGNLRMGDPAWDVANVLSLSLLTGEKEGVENPEDLLDVFQAEYYSHMDASIARRVPLYQAHYYLNRCCKYLRTGETERIALIEGMIRKAQQFVGGDGGRVVSAPEIRISPSGRTLEGPFPPALDTALDNTYMQKAIQDTIGKDMGRITSLQIAHMERRIVRYEVELQNNGHTIAQTLIGKVYDEPEQMTYSKQMMDFLWTHGFSPDTGDDVVIPTPLGCIPDICTILMTEAHGEPLRALLKKRRATPEHLQQYARAMLKLHQCQKDTGRKMGVAERLIACDPPPEAMAEAYPELAEPLHQVVAAATRLDAVLREAPPVLIHGDFHPGQVHVNQNTLWLLDVDNLKNGDPAYDLAKVFGFFKRMERKKKMSEYMTQMRQIFLETYFAGADPVVARRIPLYEALISLKRASKCLRVRDEEGWEDKMKQLVHQALACIETMDALPDQLDFHSVLEIYERSPGSV